MTEGVCESLNLRMVYDEPEELPFPDYDMEKAISKGGVVVEFSDDVVYGSCTKTGKKCPYLEGPKLDEIAIISGYIITEMEACKLRKKLSP